ncbi:MAG: hypothetical protein BWZ06_01721 [Bacteroidetes bacterium ADurb.BinA261]|nr:MAG: hypothetical protein BWZ06_01721 [Bacteroidetes bacterium ADurb.BinA261]
MLKITSVRFSFQHSKDFVDIFENFGIGSHQSFVRIYPRGFFVEVTGTQIGIPFQWLLRIVAAFADISQLSMHFQSGQTVNYFNTRLMHKLGGEIIVFFVKTSFELNKNGDFLAVFSCTDQAIDHGRILGHAILSNFDLLYLRIESRLHQKTQHVIK